MVCVSSGKWNQAIRLLPVLQEADLPLEREQALLWMLRRENGAWNNRTVHGVFFLWAYRVSQDLPGSDRSYPEGR